MIMPHGNEFSSELKYQFHFAFFTHENLNLRALKLSTKNKPTAFHSCFRFYDIRYRGKSNRLNRIFHNIHVFIQCRYINVVTYAIQEFRLSIVVDWKSTHTRANMRKAELNACYSLTNDLLRLHDN